MRDSLPVGNLADQHIVAGVYIDGRLGRLVTHDRIRASGILAPLRRGGRVSRDGRHEVIGGPALRQFDKLDVVWVLTAVLETNGDAACTERRRPLEGMIAGDQREDVAA